jgi:hypothetical protein
MIIDRMLAMRPPCRYTCAAFAKLQERGFFGKHVLRVHCCCVLSATQYNGVVSVFSVTQMSSHCFTPCAAHCAHLQVNEKFDELHTLLTTVETGLAKSCSTAQPRATASNRVELLSRTVRAMRKLWTDRQQQQCSTSTACSSSSSSSGSSPPAGASLLPQMQQFAQQQGPLQQQPQQHLPQQQQQQHSMPPLAMNMGMMQAMMAAAARGAPVPPVVKGPNGMPMMMMMPMFMPQHAGTTAATTATAAAAATAGAQPKVECTSTAPVSHTAVPAVAAVAAAAPQQQQPPMVMVPLKKPAAQLQHFKNAAAHGMHFAAPALPAFVAAALNEDAPAEAPTHAVCA